MQKPDYNKDPRAFWNARASTFPRFTEGGDSYEARMLALAKRQGVDFRDKSVLDVGCGSGMYTLRIAHEAKRITALDISDEMLRILKEDAEALHISNIEYIRSGWDAFTPGKAHDIVFCSMSPAVSDDPSRQKLLDCASEAVVFMAFAKRSPSDIMAGIYSRYNVSPRTFDAAPQMRRWLDEKSTPYTFLSLADRWDVPWKLEDFLHSCSITLQRHGIEPEQNFLSAHMEQFRDSDGFYREKTEFTAEVIVCRKSP